MVANGTVLNGREMMIWSGFKLQLSLQNKSGECDEFTANNGTDAAICCTVIFSKMPNGFCMYSK